ncbi:hypothetical protein Tco_1412294 [Tanacetum coccineum]
MRVEGIVKRGSTRRIFEPFVSSVVVNVAAVVVIGAAVVVIVVAVVVESLVGLAKGRPPDVGQRKLVSFTANANEQELFGVESPSEESHCSFPLWALRSCLPLVPYAALSYCLGLSDVVHLGHLHVDDKLE